MKKTNFVKMPGRISISPVKSNEKNPRNKKFIILTTHWIFKQHVFFPENSFFLVYEICIKWEKKIYIPCFKKKEKITKKYCKI